MATNGLNTSEDAEMADCDGQKVVTMMDVLREQQDFEEDANAVLGASDDKNCTYAKGYVKRQAIYACLTCCPDAVSDSTKRAGVCLACSLACHENHELVELYTKRNFRCDCGNPKFSQPCQFTPNKTDLNYENKYNQNFSGIYCNCKRPYPDPETTEEEEMIQCIVCEDWLHTNHLEATVPSNEQYAEMICKACMEDIDFLHDYSDLVVNVEDREIIVMDPDLDVSSIIKAKESPKKELSNGNAEAEPKDKNETVPENKDSNLVKDKQDDISADVEMGESKPDESGDGNDSSKDNTNIAEQSENKTEASGDANLDTSITNTKENQEVDNSEEKKEENIEPETNKESEEKETSGDQTTATESAENPTEEGPKNTEGSTIAELTGDKSSNDREISETESAKDKETTETETAKNKETTETDTAKDKVITETETAKDKETTETETAKDKETTETDTAKDKVITETETAKDKETTETETAKDKENTETETAKDKETTETETLDSLDSKAEADSVSGVKDETITTNPDVSADGKPQEEEIKEDNSKNATSAQENELPTNKVEHKRKLSEGDIEVSPKKQKLDLKPCVRPKGVKRVYKGATFWPTTLRHKLCTCAECLSMYKDLAVLFLIDPEDTVSAYEALGKENNGATSSQYEKGLQALSSLDRIQQINALTEYNKMRDKLLDFLKSFKDRKEIVKEEDIKAFFAGMKPKREPDGVYFCR